jgi:hypothetical protein
MKQPKALLGLFGVITLMASIFLQVLPARQAAGLQITARSLTLQSTGNVSNDVNTDGIADGGNTPGAIVNHLFQFTLPTNYTTGSQLGSLKFEYCMTAADVGSLTCVAPTGMDATVVTGVDETGSGVTGWSLGTKTTNSIVVTRSASDVAANSQVKILVQGIKNPIDDTNFPNGMTFFVRISSYTSADATGSAVDSGTVAAATTNQIKISGNMPESLVFCAGSDISTTNGVPDCTTANNATVNFNQLFSPTSTSFATSQLAASTNAGSGFAITVNGPTLTSGSNTINPIDQAHATVYDPSAVSPYSEPSRLGISQFGLNVVLNDATADYSTANPTQDPPVINFTDDSEPDSANVTPASGTGNFNGQPATGYDTNGFFKFNSGDSIANSNSTGTDAQIYTVSYVVNVPGSQPAGTYQTTLTYICTPTF